MIQAAITLFVIFFGTNVCNFVIVCNCNKQKEIYRSSEFVSFFCDRIELFACSIWCVDVSSKQNKMVKPYNAYCLLSCRDDSMLSFLPLLTYCELASRSLTQA